MKLLLDTHTLIWFLNGDNQLSKKARSLIESNNNSKFIRIASLWEIAIKIGLGKLDFNGTIDEIVELVKMNDFHVLQISQEHLSKYITLPFLHRDPFDRILIAQISEEEMTIITKDENICKYNIKYKW